MAQIYSSAAGLRVYGDNLQPAEISALLGAKPSDSHVKGQEVVGSKTGKLYVRKTGYWGLHAPHCEPEDLDGQIKQIFDQLTDDLTVWQRLNQQYEIDLFCGLFMKEAGEGFELSTESLAILGARGIKLSICVYAP